MNKTAYMVLFAAMALAIMFLAAASIGGKSPVFPGSQDEMEAMMGKALSSAPLIKEAYGAASRVLQPEAIVVDGGPIVKMPDNFLIQFHDTVDFNMDQAIDRIRALKEYCAQLNIPLYYVSFPSKATYSDLNPADFGAMEDDKVLRASFLHKIRENGIPVLDMEGVLKKRGFSLEDVFYRTDHHWKTRMGLIAAKEIAEMLKEEAHVDIHPELLTEDRFHERVFSSSWLGETGRKVSATWAGALDDYVLYEPDFETEFEYYVPSARISTEGTFSDFIDWDRFEGKPDLYDNSLHYAYMKDSRPVTHFRNRKLKGSDILLIKDSYSVPVMPFLALSCGDLTWWDMRKNQDKVFAYIDKHRFNAVVIAYTDFWRDEMYDFQ